MSIEAIRIFQEDMFPLLQIEWINDMDHQAGVITVLTASRKRLSLVDCVSFEVMRRLGITRVFCFDTHFAEQGFECLPAEDNSS